MTRVVLLMCAGVIQGFECHGHAGFADAGTDIVCAAISVLTTTCVNALESVAGVRPLVKVGDGDMYVMLPSGQTGGDAQIILRTMRCGLADVARQYPGYLKLTEKNSKVEGIPC